MTQSPRETKPQALYRELDFYQKENEPTDDLELLTVNKGLTDDQINQLIQYANTDKVVAAHSSDPQRFKNREKYDNWLEKGRFIYSMVDNKEKLLGIVWFGKSIFPNIKLNSEFSDLDTESYGITFALRIYDEARGNNIAKKLTAAAFTAYLASEDYRNAGGNGIWLETSEENVAAVKTYNTLFKQVSDPDEKGKIVMVLDPHKN